MLKLDLCLFLLFATPIFGDIYPTYSASGTHYEVGYSIGKQASDRINNYISMNTDIITMKQYIQTKQGLNEFNNLLSYNQQLYPQYFDEIRGIANGSKIDYTDILLINFEKELDALMIANNYSNFYIPSCSDMLVNNVSSSNFIGFGHNEDDSNISLSTAYFTNVTYIENNYTNTIYAFNCAPGLLIGGISPGISTSNKMVLSVNALSPINVTSKGRAIIFICRDVLNSKSIQEAINKITVGITAVGESFNIGNYENNQIVNVELSLDKYSVKYVNHSQYDYHFNKYLRINISQYPSPSSDARMNRTVQIIDNNDGGELQNLNEITSILGDTQNQQYPIWRAPYSDRNIATLVTVTYDLQNRIAKWYEQCNPKSCKATKTLLLK
eukprot:78211_1